MSNLIRKLIPIIKGFAILNKEITKKKGLILIAYMQIIILHRSYAVKQNESVVFLK